MLSRRRRFWILVILIQRDTTQASKFLPVPLLLALVPCVADTSISPLVLFIIQVFIIIGIARVIGLLLRKLRQPTVISEVLAGIVIGPTMLGRIPGFTSHIFPARR